MVTGVIYNKGSEVLTESRHTVFILVETLERVKTCLLMIFTLEWMAGLKIGMLHDCDPAGPGE